MLNDDIAQNCSTMIRNLPKSSVIQVILYNAKICQMNAKGRTKKACLAKGCKTKEFPRAASGLSPAAKNYMHDYQILV